MNYWRAGERQSPAWFAKFWRLYLRCSAWPKAPTPWFNVKDINTSGSNQKLGSSWVLTSIPNWLLSPEELQPHAMINKSALRKLCCEDAKQHAHIGRILPINSNCWWERAIHSGAMSTYATPTSIDAVLLCYGGEFFPLNVLLLSQHLGAAHAQSYASSTTRLRASL